ncbi:MAG: GDSL-type esterase/lipase family protein [Kiritimatiellae bacterium]|nr:GDSL-type esterase/lipase family protein [Kiritimatiellia bacterium]
MKTALSSILAGLLVAGLCGCGGVDPVIRKLSRDAVIVAYGDSLTSGEGVSTSESYPSVLAAITGYKVVNAGVSGEISSDGLKRLPGTLQTLAPNLVILCHGGNDILQKRSELELARNLKAMVDVIRNNGTDVIMLGVPRPGLRLKAPALYRDIARQCRIPCNTEVIPEILSKASLKSDYVHPNARGYRQLAGAVAKLIGESQ